MTANETGKKKVSILIPFYNEEAVLPELFERLAKLLGGGNLRYEWEILLINDGSCDRSLALVKQQYIRDARFRYVDLSRNFGKEIAMMAGLDYVTGDCTVIMDADLQHPPEVIPSMLEKWENGYDDVYGRRLTRGKEPWLRKKLSLAYYKLLAKSTKIPVLENVGDFRLLDRSCVEALKSMRENQRYTKGMYGYIGFHKIDVPFEQADRRAGDTKWSFIKLLNLAIDGIISYTTAPLRMATVLGFIVSIMSILYMLVIVVKTITVGESVQGFPTIMVAILFLGGVQLISLGIIGEYIGRIFNEAKHRPGYFVREVDGKLINRNQN